MTVKVVTDKGEEIIPAQTRTLYAGESYSLTETDDQVKVGVTDSPSWFKLIKIFLSDEKENGSVDNYTYDCTTEVKEANGDVTITVIYSLDNIVDTSKDQNGDEPGDGIPDKYQITVYYTVVSGSVLHGELSA